MRKISKAALAITTSILAILPEMAIAQARFIQDNEIIVTARKRNETALDAPVALTAVSAQQLERRAIARLDDIIKLVPQLQIGSTGGNSQGGAIAIRGISGSDNNPFGDQAVSFNVDGVQVSKSVIRRMAEMDLAQIEVLKGPQALFFGKNSPAGIISIRSADPTPDFQAKAALGYGFEAREIRGDGFVSGPIGETLGARLAVQGSTMRGWYENIAGSSGEYLVPGPDHMPKTKEFAVRGTLKWDPSDRFDARLKVGYTYLTDSAGPIGAWERVACPYGFPQDGRGGRAGPDDCRMNGRSARAGLGTYLASLSERYPEDGELFLTTKQLLSSYEMNLHLDDNVTLTSLTGYYMFRSRWGDNFTSLVSAQDLVSVNEYKTDEISQELRLASSFDYPLNFMIGGYYQYTKSDNGNTSFLGMFPIGGVNPTQLNNFRTGQRGHAYSLFAQLLFKPVEQIEISAGGRYSYENKRLTRVESQVGSGPGPLPRRPVPLSPSAPRQGDWDNFSPEFTISYRPTQNWNVFASYKRGFLSGGFNAGASNFMNDLRYDQQIIKGFEGGIKAELFDRTLRTNLVAYHYKVSGMQVQTSLIVDGVPVQNIFNAGKVTTKGAEFDVNYQTPLEGLTIRGAVGYNNAKYNVFSTNCWGGQTQEEGCNFGAPTSAMIGGTNYLTYSLQDLAGDPVYRAPKWSGNIGVDYETMLGGSLKAGLNIDMTFSSEYYRNLVNTPGSLQGSYQLLDAGVRVGDENGRWELALIGTNLTNKMYAVRSNDQSFTGSGAGRSANDPRGRVLSDQIAFLSRGREVMLRFTVRYGN